MDNQSPSNFPLSHQAVFGYLQENIIDRKLTNEEGTEGLYDKQDEIQVDKPPQIMNNYDLNKDSEFSDKNNPKDPFLPSRDDDNESVVDNENSGEDGYQLYPYRHFNLALFCLAALTNQIAWISMQPIAVAAQNAYDLDEMTVNTISLVYMGVFVIFNFPSNYILDTYGIRMGVTFGVIMQALGMWVKTLINQGFWICILGQMFAACGQPFLANASAKLAAQWYGGSGRVIATTLGTAAMPLGAAIGFVLPTFFVTPEDKDDPDKEKVQYHIFLSLLVQAIIGTVAAIMIAIFFREKPLTPPSASATIPKVPFGPSIKSLLKNNNLLLLMIIFGLIQSVFNTLGTMVGQIASRYGYNSDDSSLFGAVFIIGGFIGSAVFGVWVQKKKTYKLSVIFISLLSTISTLGLLLSFVGGIYALTAFFCFIVGFSMIPIMAVGFELGVEVTHPVGESVTTGFLMSTGQILGIAYTVLSSQLLSNMSGKLPCLISLLLFIVSCGISFLMAFFIKEDLRRLRGEGLYKQQFMDAPTQDLLEGDMTQ